MFQSLTIDVIFDCEFVNSILFVGQISYFIPQFIILWSM